MLFLNLIVAGKRWARARSWKPQAKHGVGHSHRHKRCAQPGWLLGSASIILIIQNCLLNSPSGHGHVRPTAPAVLRFGPDPWQQGLRPPHTQRPPNCRRAGGERGAGLPLPGIRQDLHPPRLPEQNETATGHSIHKEVNGIRNGVRASWGVGGFLPLCREPQTSEGVGGILSAPKGAMPAPR